MVFIDWQVILIRLAIKTMSNIPNLSHYDLFKAVSNELDMFIVYELVFLWFEVMKPLIWFSYDPESNSYIEILIWEYVAWVLLISAVGLQTDQSVLSACHGLWNGLHGIIISLCPPCHSWHSMHRSSEVKHVASYLNTRGCECFG